MFGSGPRGEAPVLPVPLLERALDAPYSASAPSSGHGARVRPGLATLVQPRRALADAPTLSVTVTPLAERVKAGDTLDFQLSWSCSGTSSSCSDALIEVPLPTLAPDNTQRVEFIRATDSTGGLLNFSNNGDRVLRWRGAAVPAGSSGQIQITLRTQNLITPDGSTVTPVATFTAAGATAATASATTTITAINDMITDKRVVGFSRYDVADIGLGRQVSYQISTMHANQQGWSGLVEHTSDNGYVGLQNVRTTDVLPEGAEFVRATLGGTYDPATRTVSWPAWSEPGTTPNYELVVRYPSPDFALGQMVTNTASATANPYQRPDEVLHSQASTTSHLVEPAAKGTISKGYAYPPQRVGRTRFVEPVGRQRPEHGHHRAARQARRLSALPVHLADGRVDRLRQSRAEEGLHRAGSGHPACR